MRREGSPASNLSRNPSTCPFVSFAIFTAPIRGTMWCLIYCRYCRTVARSLASASTFLIHFSATSAIVRSLSSETCVPARSSRHNESPPARFAILPPELWGQVHWEMDCCLDATPKTKFRSPVYVRLKTFIVGNGRSRWEHSDEYPRKN
jgi:hypothetical protein